MHHLLSGFATHPGKPVHNMNTSQKARQIGSSWQECSVRRTYIARCRVRSVHSTLVAYRPRFPTLNSALKQSLTFVRSAKRNPVRTSAPGSAPGSTPGSTVYPIQETQSCSDVQGSSLCPLGQMVWYRVLRLESRALRVHVEMPRQYTRPVVVHVRARSG